MSNPKTISGTTNFDSDRSDKLRAIAAAFGWEPEETRGMQLQCVLDLIIDEVYAELKEDAQV